MRTYQIIFPRIFCVILTVMLGCLYIYPIKKDNTGKRQEIPSAERDLQSLFSDIVANTFPKEKVYLHIDNNCYYKDDTLWFCAYLVNADGNTSDAVSKTLYVDLLNPGGDIIDTKVLKVENGRANGSFQINSIPLYSGFYEIRAYTKYMMNFGSDCVFSRVIPVFDAPKKEGDYQRKKMRSYGSGHYQYLRKNPEKCKNMDVLFYPEGGRLIKGIPAKVALEAKDKAGHPIDIEGFVLSATGDTVVSFKTMHEGKGVFSIVPDGSALTAIVKYKDKSKKTNLPETYPNGYTISVDNISNKDSISITVNRAGIYNRKDTVGVVLTSHGAMKAYTAVASSFRNPVQISFCRRELSDGVAEVTLIDNKGRKIADRLLFNPPDSMSRIEMAYKFDKSGYDPYEAVNLDVSLSDTDGNPVITPFSISVRDGADEIDWNRNIMTDLLLMSDIKGYVVNPGYYFESDDITHRRHLDLLMMVQGWRKYPWESLAYNRNRNLTYKPETEGIEIAGTVRSLMNKPMANVDVTAFLMKGGHGDDNALPPMDVTRTDSLGRFSFTVNLEGRRSLILNSCRKNKLIHSQISLDKGYVPTPRRYSLYELKTPSLQRQDEGAIDSISVFDKPSLLTEDESALVKRSDDKSTWLNEVEVKAKRNWQDDARAEAKKRAVAYYDVDDEVNALRDKGAYIDMECDIHKLIMKVNPNFRAYDWYGDEMLDYKGKKPLVIVDYERASGATRDDYFKYKVIRLESIKSISISEDAYMKAKYCWNHMTMMDADDEYSCVVLIETYPDGKIKVDGGKGIRKTTIHGYDMPQEFYSPDYSYMPLEKDYRRTLYWNPALMPDEKGHAKIRFYNNGNRSNFKVDMQTVTSDGAIGSTEL